MTNPTYVGEGATTNVAAGTGATLTGATVNAGDILIGLGFNASAFTQDSNWSSLSSTVFAGTSWSNPPSNPMQDGNTGNCQIFAAKVAAGSGAAADTFNPGYAGTGAGLAIFGFRGQDATTPIDGNARITQVANGASNTSSAPAVTPSVNDDILVVIYAEASSPQNITTPPSGFLSAITVGAAGGARYAAYYKALTGQSGVAQGPTDMVWAGAPYGPAVAFLIKAAAAAGQSVASRIVMIN